jgi:hypothetical protein
LKFRQQFYIGEFGVGLQSAKVDPSENFDVNLEGRAAGKAGAMVPPCTFVQDRKQVKS